MLSKRRIQRLIAARKRQAFLGRNAFLVRILTYTVLSAASAAVWAGIGALVLRLSGIGVWSFGGAMFCATLFSVCVVCNGNTNEEAF